MRKAAVLLFDCGSKSGVAKRLFGHHMVQRSFTQTAPVSASLLTGRSKPYSPICQNAIIPLCHSSQRSCSQLLPNVGPVDPDKLYSLVEVECRGHEPAVLRSYLSFVSSAAGHLDINLQEVEWPRKHIQRWTLLKSVHIYKKHRVQYEVRTHFLIMKFAKLTGSTADTFLEYIQRNLPEGMAMKVTKHELQKLPEHVKPSSEVVQ